MRLASSQIVLEKVGRELVFREYDWSSLEKKSQSIVTFEKKPIWVVPRFAVRNFNEGGKS